MRQACIAMGTAALIGLVGGAAWPQQPPAKVEVNGRQFLLNQNQQLTTAIADLLDENGKLRDENAKLTKRAEDAEAANKKTESGKK